MRRNEEMASRDFSSEGALSTSSITSTSECGKSSERPYPPTASTAIPFGKAVARCSRYAECRTLLTRAVLSARTETGFPSEKNRSRIARKVRLEGRFAALIIANTDGFGHIVNEDLAVADFACFGRRGEGCDHFFRAGGSNHQLHFDFGKEVDLV